ncbi:glycosyltransferase family 22 protein [Leucogyrophana mollusca]|uniref:Glycosyltransferase family 22 protein n=1 Tax=Leucogyrophana mollusca TaxID=85980 RepID=A0ACB8B855_9AGAM|nr:glycosyltransferase family 22 protein [Leucogyrophana mollusca]
MSFLMDCLLLATGWTHVLLAPYTKVEESFNLHATHDVLMYGVGRDSLSKYDHFTFPGAVPRTFIGSIVLAWLSAPLALFASSFGLLTSKVDLQLVVRLVLATVNAIGFVLIRRAVSKRFGRPTGLLYVLLTCSQFHLPFWMGRTLPNMFALFPVNVAFSVLLNRASNVTKPSPSHVDTALMLLTFTTVVFRAEIALLLAPLALQALVLGHTSFLRLVKVGLLSGLVSVALTVIVDSYFWDRWPLWAELYCIYFNVYLGKSSEWGTSPAHEYLTAHLPKLLLGSLPLAFLGAILDGRIRSLLVPPIVFVALISAMEHKEWRFIVYVVPLFNVAAARGARWMVSRRKSRFSGRIIFAAAMGILALNCVVTIVSTRASMVNYPGGTALVAFNKRYADEAHVHVHISNLAAQTGASLFLQVHSPPQPSPISAHWIYNKTEALSHETLTASTDITHLIAESPEAGGGWIVAESVSGFSRWKLNVPSGGIKGALKKPLHEWLDLVEMDTSEQLWILERAGR